MKKYSNIAVIYGGDSSECEISRKSGEFVASQIDGSKYSVFEIYAKFGDWKLVAYRPKLSDRIAVTCNNPRIDKTDFSVQINDERIKLEYAYIMIHGNPGETGKIQGLFEIINVPYNSCSSFVSSITFDKYACKRYLSGMKNIHLPQDYYVQKGEVKDEFTIEGLSNFVFPVFVKPTNAGSSFGVSKVYEASGIKKALLFAFDESDTVLIEQGIVGREITCGAFRAGDEVISLPIVEIISGNDFFDYEAKYLGKSKEICPANVPEDIENEIKMTTRKIYEFLKCKGVIRVDYILSNTNILYFIELNSIPGMTDASLVPKMITTAGYKVSDFLTMIIENS